MMVERLGEILTIKVAVSGLWFPCTMMGWFVRALQRRNDVELFLVGPHFGNYIPWGGGIYLKDEYVQQIDVPLPTAFAHQMIPYKMIAGQCPTDVDVWLQIDAGWHMSDRPNAEIVAHVLTDPHVLRPHYDKIAGVNDYTFCMQTPYMRNGEHYLPYAYDPNVHYPDPQPQEYDAALIGLLYEHRNKLITRLRNNGRNVYYNIGEILDEYRIRYNKSKVAINWSSLDDLPARVWEYAAMNIPFVSNRITDQSTFLVPGQHFSEFTNLQSGVDAVEYLLDHYDEAIDMSNSAHSKITANGSNTWDARIVQMLETMRIL